MTAARVTADRGRCIGSGQCSLALPEVFDADEEGLVTVDGDAAARVGPARLRGAVRLCPVRALTLEEVPAPGVP
ncbi:ferredoxin [Streptosporangium sp. NPDC048047]|uniref:ferredoxin n=1 Tax=Streptosporangium sp. NPDC048047 TaxID=3155748 RepID=UPI003424499E